VQNNSYLNFGKHENLRALCINEDLYHEEDEGRDWEELTFIVPTKWLKEFCQKEFEVNDLDAFLKEEYTSDESEIIFEEALNNRQVVMVDFI
jgi:hypothetical protein